MKRRRDTIVRLPHLNATIIVRHKIKGDRDYAAAYTKQTTRNEYILSIPLPVGPKRAATLVHEIVHILQLLVEDNSMSFPHEREHLAYIAGYLFEQVYKL